MDASKNTRGKKSARFKAEDLSGKKFGRLTVLERSMNGSKQQEWRCLCSCGQETLASSWELTKGLKKSCGCLKKETQYLVHDRLHLIDGTCIEWLVGRKYRADNTSGFRGVFKKKNGRYSVSIGFKKRVYHIGVYEEFEDAVKARLLAEKRIHYGFLTAHNLWLKKSLLDPEWGEANPFRFDVSKQNGILVIQNSMEEFM